MYCILLVSCLLEIRSGLLSEYCISLAEVTATANQEEAFKDIDAAILVGAWPRKEGMERKDLLRANIKIFSAQGKALDQFAKKTVKVCTLPHTHSYSHSYVHSFLSYFSISSILLSTVRYAPNESALCIILYSTRMVQPLCHFRLKSICFGILSFIHAYDSVL